MSPPGRPKGEYRRAQREGSPVRPPGRPKGELCPLGGCGGPPGIADPKIIGETEIP
jgi:hypothetical protein